MWTHYFKLPSLIFQSKLLFPENIIQQQIRTTFILKRRYAPLLHKKGGPPKRLKNKHYIYDLVQDTNTVRQPNLDVILTRYVEGLGNRGDKVSVRPNYAYNELLLPGLAVYVTPENIEKYKKCETTKDTTQYSSSTVQKTINTLSKMTLSVIMNKDMPWILKPWHIRTSFRKCGYHVPEETIEMPPQTIQGPNMDIENKEFIITIMINKTEKVKVNCRIHHWSTSVTEKLPYDFEFWKKPSEPIFQDQIEN